MKIFFRILIFCFCQTSIAVFAQDPAPPSTLPEEEKQATGDAQQGVESPAFEFEDEDYEYDPIGKRDPFKSFIKVVKAVEVPVTKPVVVKGKAMPAVVITDPLLKYTLDDYKILGILSNTANPRALIEIDGKTYVMYRNMKLGRNGGVIREIREGEIVVSEQLEIDGKMKQETKLLQIK